LVRAEKFTVNIQIAYSSGGSADLANGTPEGFGSLRKCGQIGRGIQYFEHGFQAASAGTKLVNGFWLGIVEASGHCGLQSQRVTKKCDDWLRH
jgi:hypothetical protein